ncbi:MAG: DeoR/GlpR family DNA-binding transcription regulator [Propionibacteriaceae bacterium]|jgi:DeoR/GlpR family transcriptional regulator of sugar metabolism|nr:DeoR/GlpR family DNA-binding transcription regulator [Propionibacteriaceae bacterium]
MAEDCKHLIPAQRREQLVHKLRQEGGVLSVRQLMDLLGVSHMTVRRDIATLEREGLAHSIPGGVRLGSNLRHEPAFPAKMESERSQKTAIAAAAAKLVHDDMVIYLDAGTTTGALVPLLLDRRCLTVITNDFAIVDALMMSACAIDVIHVGGHVELKNHSTVGHFAADMLRQLSCDLAFISTSSWDLSRGITTPSESKVAVKLAAIESSSSATLLATSSKFGQFGTYKISPLQRFDRVITDDGLSPAAAQGIRDVGVVIDCVPVAEVGAA